jgi:hypothetical protein
MSDAHGDDSLAWPAAWRSDDRPRSISSFVNGGLSGSDSAAAMIFASRRAFDMMQIARRDQ